MFVAQEAVETRVLRRHGQSIREMTRMLDVLRDTVDALCEAKGCSSTGVNLDRASWTPISITSTRE
jgi:hypothetical protein